jgi:hypothetical protein
MIKENLTHIDTFIPEGVVLVAVSKTKPIADLQEAYDANQRDFGENKVQEMAQKQEALPKDIKWHMIGHVQTNKVKYMAPFVHLIHGVDSFKLLKEINKQAKINNRVIKCLLQARIAKEETKFGLPFDEIQAILSGEDFRKLENIEIVGFMGMASFTEDEQQLTQEFSALEEFYTTQKEQHSSLRILSMGMSGDYQLAIKNGSNMVRIGSAIFGARNYIV